MRPIGPAQKQYNYKQTINQIPETNIQTNSILNIVINKPKRKHTQHKITKPLPTKYPTHPLPILSVNTNNTTTTPQNNKNILKNPRKIKTNTSSKNTLTLNNTPKQPKHRTQQLKTHNTKIPKQTQSYKKTQINEKIFFNTYTQRSYKTTHKTPKLKNKPKKPKQKKKYTNTHIKIKPYKNQQTNTNHNKHINHPPNHTNPNINTHHSKNTQQQNKTTQTHQTYTKHLIRTRLLIYTRKDKTKNLQNKTTYTQKKHKIYNTAQTHFKSKIHK